jgi:hypothetical protein
MKENKEQGDGSTSENNASDPSSPHRTKLMIASNHDIVGIPSPPSQHARVTVARAVEVGELENTHEDNGDGIANAANVDSRRKKVARPLANLAELNPERGASPRSCRTLA